MAKSVDDMVINKRVNIKRYKEIISVFAKHGFGLLFDQLGIFDYLKMERSFHPMREKTTAQNSPWVSESGCPVKNLANLCKNGSDTQYKADVIPSDIIEELKKLQDSVHPFSFDEVRTVIESEFEDKIENIFMEFSEEPIAAASISQVHCARLKSEETVRMVNEKGGRL